VANTKAVLNKGLRSVVLKAIEVQLHGHQIEISREKHLKGFMSGG
jgi:hypothetical protein